MQRDHYFLKDGGAHSIAGLRLERHHTLVYHLFAWAGATQLVWELIMVAVVWRYQALVPLVLALLVVERALHLWTMWFGSKKLKGHPPEYMCLVAVPANAVFLLLAVERLEGRALVCIRRAYRHGGLRKQNALIRPRSAANDRAAPIGNTGSNGSFTPISTGPMPSPIRFIDSMTNAALTARIGTGDSVWTSPSDGPR